MRILIDCRCLQTLPPRSGVGAYAEQLTRALIVHGNAKCKSQNAKLHEFLLFANGLVDPQKYLPHFDAPNVRWVVTRWPNKVFNLSSALSVQRSAFKGVDVVFLPNLNFIPPLPARTRLVVTVHDLSFEHFSDCFTWKQRLWHRAIRPQILIARADAIVAVSETTKRDLMETYGVPEGKVTVVYPGLPPSSFRGAEGDEKSHTTTPLNPRVRSLVSLEMTKKMVLSIAELSPRKNIDGLIAAFELLDIPHSTLHIHLVVAGIPGSASRTIRQQVARSSARGRIHLLGPVTENEKRALLARASCFVYPSLWEGFGFPPLEARDAGVPVVASTGGALPEILGSAALLVDPLDPAAIAEAITRACTDDALRANLIARGRARAAQFRWDAAAAQTLEVLIRQYNPQD